MFSNPPVKPLLVSVQKIWDQAPHNALTDLIIYKDHWYCVFRESDMHVHGSNGVIRILGSDNGMVWEPIACLEIEGLDLRDPKLSITPQGKLMLLAGATRFNASKKHLYHQSLTSFSEDGVTWSEFQPILNQHEWLWRVTWNQGNAYGISYRFSDPTDRSQERITSLWKSPDGINYQLITEFKIPGKPNESTLRFLPSGQMMALVRREKIGDNYAWIGTSFPPYEDWLWTETKQHIGGPNFIILDNVMWAAGRFIFKTPYAEFPKTALALMTSHDLYPILVLPSSGDNSYPGMLYKDGFLYLSYYSSHQDNTAIYLAKIDLGTAYST